LRNEKAISTHPAKTDRLNEIERGWTKGNNYSNKINDTCITDADKNDDIPGGMQPLVQEQYRKAKNNGNAEAQNSLGYAYMK
jgi:hypothetical protein